MNMNQNKPMNKRLEKLAVENTAFNNCRHDMSDVSFEIGNSSYLLKACGALVLLAVVFGGRFLIRRKAGNPEYTLSTIDILFWIFIGGILIYTIVATIMLKSKPTISVAGKTVFYNGNCWTSDEITCVKCSKFLEVVNVYSYNKKVLSFAWERDNSELFIAWAKKCGIIFEDNRIS
ncbi:MAG: hypothetical protein IKI94_13645 [Ruminococcus sp.]|nr:hypothetical protein [Ruminococcus sp.]